MECRQEAFDTYHETLCFGPDRTNENHPYNLLIDAWRSTHLPPETTTINLIIKMIAIVKQAVNKEVFIQKLQNFESALVQEHIPHKLLGAKYFVKKILS